MIYHTVTFTITRKCNLSCPICCFHCNPTYHEVLDDTIIEKAIRSLGKERRVRCIAISGGEPMLYPDKVMKITRWASEVGKEVALYTNGFWCQTVEKTRSIMVKLKSRGLTTLLTSVDAFHQEHIPIKNICYLLKVCRELGIETRVHSSVTYSTLEKTDMILQKLGEYKLGTSVSQSAVIPIGAAKRLDDSDIIRQLSPEGTKCSIGMCDVDWNGNVYACCSQCQNDRFLLGNINETDICTILNNIRKSPCFMLLIKEGLCGVAQKAEKIPTFPLRDRYADSCELCYEIFTNETVFDLLVNDIQVTS